MRLYKIRAICTRQFLLLWGAFYIGKSQTLKPTVMTISAVMTKHPISLMIGRFPMMHSISSWY